ncbi:S1C family serine protease [Paenibacillus sp. MBLB4367]|uniref:S1C family serine protease n=1 Tax=Paenibacillus sp. MBLB4367 TaxID=3384767 RepID=UPI0039080903
MEDHRPTDVTPRKKMAVVVPAFLAGALFIGSFMLIAAKFNNSGEAPASSPSAAAGNPAADGVTTASLSLNANGGYHAIASAAGPATVKIEAKVNARTGGFRQQAQTSGTGTGFIYEKSGYIVTNEHVIDGADEIMVLVQGFDQPFQAQVIESRYDLDLAILKISGDRPFSALTIAESDQTQIGESVAAIGNPYDLDYTLTTGVLSATERKITIPDDNGTRDYEHLLQTDTAINPGNSGGPLLNRNGEVIGVNTAVSAEAQGIGFAIPASTIRSVLDSIIK